MLQCICLYECEVYGEKSNAPKLNAPQYSAPLEKVVRLMMLVSRAQYSRKYGASDGGIDVRLMVVCGMDHDDGEQLLSRAHYTSK